MDEALLKINARLSGELASDGMVLLENRADTLPFEPGCRIALFGRGQVEFTQGGTGSAGVRSLYIVTPVEGLSEPEHRLVLDPELIERYRADHDYLPDEATVAAAAARNDAACVILSRNAGEHSDREDAEGDFRLSEAERQLLGLLGSSPFKRVVVVVNSGGLIELGWFRDYTNFGALLLCWQPGMEGARSLAKILCGEINPSGHLVDTIAEKYEDWPSAAGYQLNRRRMEYTEDIYVGYRYFETIPGAAAHVLYPFGYGLSYTTFEIGCSSCECDGKTVTLRGSVTNTGKRAGRQVVQCYVAASGADRPALELKGFAKTGVIPAGGSEEYTISFPVADLRRFDDTGAVCGKPGSFVLEAGEYTFRIGSSVRDTFAAGSWRQPKTVILETPGNIFTNINSSRLHADGSRTVSGAFSCEVDTEITPDEPKTFDPPIMLQDVADGKASLDDFVSQLTIQELVTMCQGQPPALPRTTGGIGFLKKFGVPNPQTADGPAGIRRGVPTTCFPCATLIACTWDPELQFKMGETIGHEGLDNKIDILLAPGLNIHRNPLCGRNFEYYSEDPLIAGRSASAMVRGVQSTGMGATIKHFAANSRENTRRVCDSIISDRALREIYLRGFEIAVKEAKPWCIMSSYNLINGTHTSASYPLLTQLLRNEWGFDGVVMTDWVTTEQMLFELLAGNDLKMPRVTPDEIRRTAMRTIEYALPRKLLERSVKRLLSLVMKTPCFKNRDFGYVSEIPTEGLRVDGQTMVGLGHSGPGTVPSTDPEGGKLILHRLNRNGWGMEPALYYRLKFARSGDYRFRFRVTTPSTQLSIELLVDGVPAGILPIRPTMPDDLDDPSGATWKNWETQGDITAHFEAGRVYMVRMNFPDPSRVGTNFNFFEVSPV